MHAPRSPTVVETAPLATAFVQAGAQRLAFDLACNYLGCYFCINTDDYLIARVDDTIFCHDSCAHNNLWYASNHQSQLANSYYI